MAFDKFLIAPLENTGFNTALKPWQIPEQAFTELNNAYVFRGRTRKRFGALLTGVPTDAVLANLYSRAGIPLAGGAAVGITDAGGNATGTVPGSIFKVGQQFSIGTQIYTVHSSTAGAQPMFASSGAATTKTYNIGTGAYVFAGATALTQIYFYPSESIMGLTQYEVGAINNQPAIAFDTQFAYIYTGVFWSRMAVGGAVWHDPTGLKLNFFWSTNYRGLLPTPYLFTTNFQVNTTPAVTDDPIWYYNGTTWIPFTYSPSAVINPTNIQPKTVFKTLAGDPTRIVSFVQTARIIVAFKERLLLLNTIENTLPAGYPAGPTGITDVNYLTSTNIAYPQRLRYSHKGDAFSTSAWLEPNQLYDNLIAGGVKPADGAGFVDASTEEQIVSAEFIKDRLIVYFERSTWEIVETGNPGTPFKWQKINTELGSEATFSTVPFDREILTVGTTGVLSCTGANVARIDQNIPDQIYDIKQKNNAINRVAGIRDYQTEMVYWAYPNQSANEFDTSYTYPNKILVYNYVNKSWATNDDCITAFGYFEQQTDKLWSQMTMDWNEANFAWNSNVIASQDRKIIAGTPQGFIFTVEPEDISVNAYVVQITNMTVPNVLTIIDHGFAVGDYIDLKVFGVTLDIPTQTIYYVTAVTKTTVTIDGTFTGTFTYGYARRASQINIFSRDMNPYSKEDTNVYVAKIDFQVDNEIVGEVTVSYYNSSNYHESMLDQAEVTGMLLGTGILETGPYLTVPFEIGQTRLWHPVNFQVQGEFFMFQITLSDAQMKDSEISNADFQLHSFLIYCTRTGQMR